jgi:choline dehydrogenase-like flavoprotein
MELDARSLSDGTSLDANVCIIGFGPAGITLAREFIGKKINVVILESGGLEPEEDIQKLHEGVVVGDSYAGLRQTRYRGVGGTTHLWNTPVAGKSGAKYVPLDPYDFDERSDPFRRGWPFDYWHLQPFYRRAQEVCGLGPFAYEGAYWSDDKGLFELNDECLTNCVYQFGPGRFFTRSYPQKILDSRNIVLCHHATACRLESSSVRVTAVKFSSVSKAWCRVRAGIFVLAAGAIENARLLLLSGEAGSDAFGNRYGWVGRCFMEHLRDYALTWIPKSPEMFHQAAFYDARRVRDNIIIGGRIALTERAIRDQNLPNASITLLPRAKTSPNSGPMGRLLARLGKYVKRRSTLGYGWSRTTNLSRRYDAFQLLINFEQHPNSENRIMMTRKTDAFGVPQVELHWRWEEMEALERLRAIIAREFEAANLGQVEIRHQLRPDPNAHHHSGTTRMNEDPRYGVTDGNGRVHDMDNLYVTGSSLFPSAGFANPTLTIVALALRLADHLIERV